MRNAYHMVPLMRQLISRFGMIFWYCVGLRGSVGNIEVHGTNATQTRSMQAPVQHMKIVLPSSLAVFPLPGLLILSVYGFFVATFGRLVVLYIRFFVCI